MKNAFIKYFLNLLLLCCVLTAYPQGLIRDVVMKDLVSDSLVKEFVIHTNYTQQDRRWTAFNFTTGQEVAASFVPGKRWIKIDLNKDGQDDLIVNGLTEKGLNGKYTEINFHMLVYLSSDSGYHKIDLSLWNELRYPVYFNVCTINQKPFIELIKAKGLPGEYLPRQLVKDTLMLHDDYFVNYTKQKSLELFDSIFFTNSSGMTIQRDSFSIDRKGNMRFKKGDFRKYETFPIVTLAPEHLQKFLALAEVIDTSRLKHYYTVGQTDCETNYLIFKYKNGSEYKIKDYGGAGNNTLSALYKQIFSFIKNTKWE